MKIPRPLTAIVAAGIIALAGCGNNSAAPNPDIEKINGVPLSVANDSSISHYLVSTVLDVDGNRIVAYTENNSLIDSMLASALIRAEINDNDNDSIELRGYYHKDNNGNDVFRFSSATIDNRFIAY
tara:strand:- start:258 stop:635 length:378 start_codon:yes stop_codon:yes gene_type:complete